MRTLQRAHYHTLQLLHGGEGATAIKGLFRDANAILNARGEYLDPPAEDDWAGLREMYSAGRKAVLRDHTRIANRMRQEQIEAFQARCRARFIKPGAKEISRFLGKRAGRLDLWGLLPKDKARWYPSVARVQGTVWKEGVQAALHPSVRRALERACDGPEGEWVTLLNTFNNDRIGCAFAL